MKSLMVVLTARSNFGFRCFSIAQAATKAYIPVIYVVRLAADRF